ncbi:MAG: hypothetical protein ACRDT6_10315 [Micromonosporaceae bacterium]
MTTSDAAEQGWTVRLGAVGGIAGSLLAMVGNLLHPATPSRDPQGVARVIADSALWLPVHLVIVVGLVLMLGGMAAIHRTVSGGLAGALSRLGWAAAIAGITIGVILVGLDGIAAKHLALAWASAPPSEAAAALRILTAEETVNFALAALFNLVFAGVTFILYGLAVAASGHYPPWLGWIVVAPGVLSVVVSAVQAYAGESTGLTFAAGIISPTVITLWVAGMCGLLLRRSRS